ncbi:MAG: dihydrofolate reductase [Haloferacaceae archaeon]
MRVVLVAAVAANGVIGADGETPWHLPADLAHFRRTTVGHPVVMGRRTHESVRRQVGGPLPDRTNVVLTSRPDALPDDVVAVSSVEAALAAAAETGAETTYVVGGGSVYEQFLPHADGMVLSELRRAVEGDTWFPGVDPDRWRVTDRETYSAFDVVTYSRDEE